MNNSSNNNPDNSNSENNQHHGAAQGAPDAGKDFLIVGIGASAGGIKALQDFFANVSAESNMAYVVILHLSPDHESRLAEVLQNAAVIPVTQVEDHVHVEPNHVYVIPPNKSLTMADGTLALSDIRRVEQRRAPIDIFFRTLGESHSWRAATVVLSGTGADGSMGMKRVKEKGGVCIVQDPNEAQFSDMPRNSIATNLVDYVLPVAEIPSQLVAYYEHLKQIQLPDEHEEPHVDVEAALRLIFTTLRVRTGHDFTNYKRSTLLRRIGRRMGVREMPDMEAYASFLRSNTDEAQALLKDLLISVTNFFRDREAFEALERNIIPKLFGDKEADDHVRVWVAGCATGEEAYSLAMLLSEFAGAAASAPHLKVFATDIDEDAIAFAREGYYTLNDAADVSPARLERFFTKEGDGYRVRRELREMVLFAHHNLIRDPPFTRVDLVTCRNLLIYLNRTAQAHIMDVFNFALNPGGYLFLGGSESIEGANDLFVAAEKEHNIFQSRAIAAPSIFPIHEMKLSHDKDSFVGAGLVPAHVESSKHGQGQALPLQTSSQDRISQADLHQRLLEQYAAPSVIVNEDYDIIHLSLRVGRFMQVGGGEPSHNLLKLIHPELRLELRSALYQAVQRRTNVEAHNIRVQFDGHEPVNINLTVRPVLRDDDAARGFILVLIEETGAASGDAGTASTELVAGGEEPMARQLEEQLMRVRSQLRATVEQGELQNEELRASNEELQAMNEELRSAAEELETGKEELQSVNEELTTVNQELKVKIEELKHSDNDIRNLINSADVGTIFLDRELRLKFFTPRTRDLFKLIPADVGRPLTDIRSKLGNENLIADVDLVLKKLHTVEREVETNDGQTFLAQISPYRTSEDYINGVVISFINITARKRAEEEIRQSAARLAQQARVFDRTLSSISDYAYTFDLDGRFIYANQPLLNLLELSLDEVVGKNFYELPYPKDLADRLQRQIRQVIETKEIVIDETPFVNPAGAEGYYEYIFTPFMAADGSVEVVAGSTRDTTARRQAEEKLRDSEERYRRIVKDATDYAIMTLDPNGIITDWNAGAERTFGYTEEEAIGQHSALIFTPEDRAAGEHEKEIREARATGRAADERWHLRKDNSRFYMSGVMTPLNKEDGTIIGFAKIARDLTAQRNAEDALRLAHDEMENRVQARTHELATSNTSLREEIVERKLSEKTRLRLLRQLVTSQEDERRRIARDLHDHLGQQLTALRLKIAAIKDSCGKDKKMCRQAEEVEKLAAQVDADVDFLAWELRPAALDDLGLSLAINNYVREWASHFNTAAQFHSSNLTEVRLAPEIETNLYRITQEALNNTQKHAQASRVDVLLERRDGHVVLIVEDDGIGFDTDKKTGFDPNIKGNSDRGLGLVGMRERAALLGGTVEIESDLGSGTTIFARIPITLAADES
jgi:two-component system CheB/CheR fusion protein